MSIGTNNTTAHKTKILIIYVIVLSNMNRVLKYGNEQSVNHIQLKSEFLY